MKLKYEKINVTLVVFESEDVLTSSTSFVDLATNTSSESDNFAVNK